MFLLCGLAGYFAENRTRFSGTCFVWRCWRLRIWANGAEIWIQTSHGSLCRVAVYTYPKLIVMVNLHVDVGASSHLCLAARKGKQCRGHGCVRSDGCFRHVASKLDVQVVLFRIAWCDCNVFETLRAAPQCPLLQLCKSAQWRLHNVQSLCFFCDSSWKHYTELQAPYIAQHTLALFCGDRRLSRGASYCPPQKGFTPDSSTHIPYHNSQEFCCVFS